VALTLVPGANTALATGTFEVALTWRGREDADADLSALVCSGRRVRSDADFVFFNQRVHGSGAVRHEGKSAASGTVTDVLRVDLAGVEPDVDLLVVVASLDAGPGAGFGLLAAAGLRLTVRDGPGGDVAVVDLSGLERQTAVVAAEFYRRDGGWKLRAVGQGWDDGLAGLARDFGVDVEAPDEGPPAPPVPSFDWRDPPVPAGYGR
jgi:tellurite resistance protein TerA